MRLFVKSKTEGKLREFSSRDIVEHFKVSCKVDFAMIQKIVSQSG